MSDDAQLETRILFAENRHWLYVALAGAVLLLGAIAADPYVGPDQNLLIYVGAYIGLMGLGMVVLGISAFGLGEVFPRAE